MSPNATPEERDLHRRLLQGDETASSEIFALFFQTLLTHLAKFYPLERADNADSLRNVVCDALLNFTRYPERFDPEKGSLLRYLQMDTEADLKNFLSSRQKKSTIIVALDRPERNSGNELENQQISADQLDHARRKLHELLPDEPDFQIVWQMLVEGERDTAVFAEILQLQDLPADAQAKEVKKHKDRIQKRLVRGGWEQFVNRLKDE